MKHTLLAHIEKYRRTRRCKKCKIRVWRIQAERKWKIYDKTIMKRNDKRNFFLLSTKHSKKFVQTYNKREVEKWKPKIVREYN